MWPARTFLTHLGGLGWLVVPLILASGGTAQAKTVSHCSSSQVSHLEISYKPAHPETSHIACSIARNVASIEVRRLTTPGEHLKSRIRIAGQLWRYSWRVTDPTPNTSITYFTAHQRSNVVTFQLRGIN